MTAPTPPEIVPVLCPGCRREVLHVRDRPALQIRQPLTGTETWRADERDETCGWCPGCGARVCVRILRSAA